MRRKVKVKVDWSHEFKAAINAAAKELGVRPPKQARTRKPARGPHLWVMFNGPVPICAHCGIDSVTAQRKQPKARGAGPCRPDAMITLPWQERRRVNPRAKQSSR